MLMLKAAGPLRRSRYGLPAGVALGEGGHSRGNASGAAGKSPRTDKTICSKKKGKCRYILDRCLKTRQGT